jgi:hemerythrin-like domain-containing protein
MALRLRRAPEDPAEVLDEFRTFFREQSEPHFAAEERLLVPELPAALAERLLAEHRELRERVAALATATAEDLRALGELLTAHVRFEEREVFPHLERSLSQDRLSEIGAALD